MDRAHDSAAHAYVVIVTRGHTNDLEALRALAPRDLRYLGLIGSRAKVARIYDELLADAMPAEMLRQVHAPIGLDIGAVTPQEIAVSILAELIAVKHGKMRGRDAAELSMKWTPSSRSADGPRRHRFRLSRLRPPIEARSAGSSDIQLRPHSELCNPVV